MARAAGGITVRLFQNRVEDLLRGRNGPVVLHQANLGRRVVPVARGLAPRDRGVLAGSIGFRMARAARGWAVEIVAAAAHAIYVIRGNRAHWPPVGAVAGWARRHGFPAKGGAFLVARAISRRARPANNFMVKAARAVGLDARERR